MKSKILLTEQSIRNCGIMKLPCNKRSAKGISGRTDSSYVGGVTLKVTYNLFPWLTGPLALRNYLGHLVGHEGAGSLQSFLKRRGVGKLGEIS